MIGYPCEATEAEASRDTWNHYIREYPGYVFGVVDEFVYRICQGRESQNSKDMITRIRSLYHPRRAKPHNQL